MNTWQVAHATSYSHITLVLDGTSLGANPHAGVSILGIGHEWHEENLHAILCHQAGKLWELHIIANDDTYLATVSIEGLDMATATQAPALLLIWRNVNLLIHVHTTISAAEEAHIVERIALEVSILPVMMLML